MKMKKLVALGAAAAMSMTMCVNVFAASEVSEGAVDASYAGAKASYTGTFKDAEGNTLVAADGTQMTVVVLKEIAQNDDLSNDDIEYINQDVASAALYTDMGTKNDLLATDENGNAIYAGNYVIRVGFYDAKGAWHLAEGTFTIGTKQTSTGKKVVIYHGDVTADNAVNISDAGALVRYVLGVAETFTSADGDVFSMNKTYDTVLWGDANLDSVVNISDAGAVVRKVLGVEETFNNGTVKMEDQIEITLPLSN